MGLKKKSLIREWQNLTYREKNHQYLCPRKSYVWERYLARCTLNQESYQSIWVDRRWSWKMSSKKSHGCWKNYIPVYMSNLRNDVLTFIFTWYSFLQIKKSSEKHGWCMVCKILILVNYHQLLFFFHNVRLDGYIDNHCQLSVFILILQKSSHEKSALGLRCSNGFSSLF